MDVTEEGVTLQKGTRAMMLFASANRVGCVFETPDMFDMNRKNARRHPGFGAGAHMCVGMHLALLEIECLIKRLVDQVSSLKLLDHDIVFNNSIYAYSKLQVRLG